MLWKTKNRKGAYMEVVDKLNKRKEPLNKKSDRYERIDGEYCQYVHVCIMNDKNEFLLQKRSPSKKIYPNMWSQTGGAVDSGETSLQGALREVKEELGIDLNKENMEFMLSFKRFHSFVDVWLAKQNIDLKDVVIQKEEVSDVKWVSKDAFKNMINDKEVSGSVNLYYEMLMDLIENFSK